ncbi:hypothetical protein M1D97_10395 [Kushneria sp. AK178]
MADDSIDWDVRQVRQGMDMAVSGQLNIVQAKRFWRRVLSEAETEQVIQALTEGMLGYEHRKQRQQCCCCRCR